MKAKGYDARRNNRRRPGSGRPANRHSKQLKIMLAALGVLVAGLVVVGVVIYGQLTSDDVTALLVQTSTPNPADDVNPSVSGIQTKAPEKEGISYHGKTYVKNDSIVNIVFLGIDSEAERGALNHSDMMIVCAVDTVTKKAKLLTIPRDIWTDVSKIDTKTGKITKMIKQRLNTAYLFGGGPNKFGASNTKACIQNFLERKNELQTPLGFTLDIPVPYFVSIDMDGISKITDAVGGIEVTLDTTIPDVGRKGKTITLKGQKAEDYLRDRHNTAGSDFGRTARQRNFMIQLAKKIKSLGAVDLVTKLYEPFKTYGHTDLSIDQAVAFAKLLSGMDIDAIEQLVIPCYPGKAGEDEKDVLFDDEAKTLDMLLSIYYTEVP